MPVWYRRFALVGAALVAVHSLALFVTVLPPNPARAFVAERATYLQPFLYQVWDLFAPPGAVRSRVLVRVDGRERDLTADLARRSPGFLEPSLVREQLWQATDALESENDWSVVNERDLSVRNRAAFTRTVLSIEKSLYPGGRYDGASIEIEIAPIPPAAFPVARQRISPARDDGVVPCCSIALR